MILPLTSLEDAWGPSMLKASEKNNVSSNDHRVQFIRNGGTVNNTQPVHAAPSSVTKYDINNGMSAITPKRVDIALYDDSLVQTLIMLTPDERTEYVTKGLINKPKPVPKTRNKMIEYFHNTTERDEQNAKSDDLLLIITGFLIILLVDKLCTVWQKS